MRLVRDAVLRPFGRLLFVVCTLPYVYKGLMVGCLLDSFVAADVDGTIFESWYTLVQEQCSAE